MGFIFGDFLLVLGVLGGVWGVFWGLSGELGACEGDCRWIWGFWGGYGVLWSAGWGWCLLILAELVVDIRLPDFSGQQTGCEPNFDLRLPGVWVFLV